jgi:HSP20 family molecular chaperone IbpA
MLRCIVPGGRHAGYSVQSVVFQQSTKDGAEMSSPARSLTGGSKNQIAKPQVLTSQEGRRILDTFNDLVSRRAYEEFDRNGRLDGNDVSHWLQAEQELAISLPAVSDSANSFSTNLRLPETSVESVKVFVTEDRAIIYNESSAESDTDGLYESKGSTYYMVRWPEIVDPASCRAELGDDTLTVAVRRAEIDSELKSKTGTESSEGL